MNESPPEPKLFEYAICFTVVQVVVAPSFADARKLADVRQGEIVDIMIDPHGGW